MADVTIRPDVNANSLWFMNAVANINSVTNQPTVYTATLIQALDGLDDDTTQKYGFANPSGGYAAASPVYNTSLWIRGRRFPGDSPFTDAMDATIQVAGVAEPFQSVALPTAAPGGWVETVFRNDWSFSDFDDCEVHLRANNITTDGSLIVYVAYLVMSVTPAYLLSVSMSKLRDMVAESTTFQTKVEAADDTAAKQKIHIGHHDQVSATDRPYAVVEIAPGFRTAPLAGGSQNWMISEGMLRLYLTDFDRFPANKEDSIFDFYNFVGGLWEDMQDLAAKDDRLAVNEITLEKIARTHPSREEKSKGWHEAELLIGWGR